MTKQLTLPAGEEQISDAWCCKYANVPGATVGDVTKGLETEAGQAHLDRDKTQHIGLMGDRESEHAVSGNVLNCDVNRAHFRLADELMEILSSDRAVVMVVGRG